MPDNDKSSSSEEEKFRHHAAIFDAVTRHPSPYVQFTGRPGAKHVYNSLPFDALGFTNAKPITPRSDPSEFRIFVVGDSMMVFGTGGDDTVSGRLEAILQKHNPHINVYNFGVMSSCTEQMTSLIWMRLLDYDPDTIVVISGATDIFQPWTFDPRPGHPYNSFMSEYFYRYFFDESNAALWEEGLRYEDLIRETGHLQESLRAQVGWRTEEWEFQIVQQFRGSLNRLERIARSVARPILYCLEPVVVRKDPLRDDEKGKASDDFLEYMTRQYDRFEAVIGELQEQRRSSHLHLYDASRALNREKKCQFHDVVHYNDYGRLAVAEVVAEQLKARCKLQRRGRRSFLATSARRLIGRLAEIYPE